MMLDLDGFKRVNDQLGHPGGDEALREVGKRLVAVVREGDFVARLGGDEFGVLIQGLGDDPKRLEATCDRVRDVVAKTPLAGSPVTASIGAVQVTGAKTSWDEIYRSADRELYESKRSGGDQAHLLLADDFIDRLDSPDA